MNNSEQLNEIIRLSEELNSIQDIDLLFEKILTNARRFLGSDAASIQIKEKDELVFSHVQTESLQRKLPPGQKLIYTTFRTKISKNSISGYAALTGEILNIPDAYNIPSSAPYRFDNTNDIKSGYKTKSILTVPLKSNRNDILGVMQIVNALRAGGDDEGGDFCTDVGCFDQGDEQMALHFANTASMVLQRALLTRELILRMISMAELRDPRETGPHVNRVAALSSEIYEKWARLNGVNESEIEQNRDTFRMAAMLHDVGKVGISDLILKKPAKLDEEEYRIMKTHTHIGARLFDRMHSALDEMASVVAVNHHENWDGSGYPGIDEESSDGGRVTRGKRGEEIPVYGRIVALADVFDALSSKRVYKESWKEEDVLSEIRRESGKKFDPELVDIFFENFEYFRSVVRRYPEE